ncbi:MAG: serine/threonine-protein kinase [Myxococcota bacterium]
MTGLGSAPSTDEDETKPLGNQPDSDSASQERIAARVRERLFGGAPPAMTIGRFTVIEEIGRGGMGAVYSAYDDQLDRKVAIKVLTCDADEHEAQQRFQREGQAMARLSHPHVVTVHEVGESDGQSYLAMEFIRGQSLSRWMNGEPEWREVLEVFIQAGEGLAAAHDAGLVHRDLKPANIMRSDAGVVKVLDFGLARAIEDTETESLGPRSVTSSVLGSSFTRTGTVMGTPAFMAPEQLRGETVDARSDQFSFCVALHDALFGVRPFAGRTISELMIAMQHGELQPIPKGSRVPAPVRKAVLRGLSIDPAERWGSMDDLLEPLRRQAVPRRRGFIAFGVAVGLLGLGAERYMAQSERCTGAAKHLEEVWDDTRRERVGAAIRETGVSFADDTWSRVEPRLDDYAAGWSAAHTEACEATAVRHEQSDTHLDLRMGCLWELRQRLRATVDELGEADATVVEHAVEAVTELPALSRCDDVEALSAAVALPDDPAIAQRVVALDERLLVAEAKARAGRHVESLELADEVVSEAVSAGYEPLMARAWQRQGTSRDLTGDSEGAVESLQRAYDAAIAQGLLPLAGELAAELMGILADELARHEDAERWAVHAEPLSRAAHSDEVRAQYLWNRSLVFQEEGKYEQAREQAERSLEVWEKLRGPDHLDVARAVRSLGVIAQRQGHYDEARRFQERALAILERALGSEHPDVGGALTDLGIVMSAQGDYREAHETHQRALRIFEAALGPEHVQLVTTLHGLGEVLGEQREFAAARAVLERAVSVRELAVGSEHQSLSGPLLTLGQVLMTAGEPTEGLVALERAMAIRVGSGNGLPEARFALARALWTAPAAEGRDRSRARELAELVRDEGLGEGAEAVDAAELEAWLAEHRPR